MFDGLAVVMAHGTPTTPHGFVSSLLHARFQPLVLCSSLYVFSCCRMYASKLYMQVVEEACPLPDSKEHSPEFVDLIKQCLHKDPLQRPTAEALMQHPFLHKVID